MVINANELWHSLDYLWLTGVARQVVANTHQSYTVPVEVHACGILLFLYLSAQLSALDVIIYLSIISNFPIFLGHPTLHPWVSRREWELSRPFLKTEFRRRFSQPYWPPSLHGSSRIYGSLKNQSSLLPLRSSGSLTSLHLKPVSSPLFDMPMF